MYIWESIWTYAVYLEMLNTFFIAIQKKILNDPLAISIQRRVHTEDSISR